MERALDGLKVVEYCSFVAGPYCGKLFADLGAEVIKIESPERGDEARRRGPFLGDDPHPEKSLLFLYLNTNKLGITLDSNGSSAREGFIKLARWADIIIEDNPTLILEGLGLTYQELQGLNPGLILTSITPFGQTGPHRGYKAYPINIYHGGGLGYVSPTGVETPLKSGGLFSEYACGLTAATGTLAALYNRRMTGLGQQVDTSKQEAILNLARVQIDRYPNEGVIQNRLDIQKGIVGTLKCQDGYVALVANQTPQWQALFKLIDNSKMQTDDKYLDDGFREQNREEINRCVIEWMMNHTREEIYHRGQALGLPITPVMSARDIAASPQFTARQFFTEAVHPVAGKLKYPGTPYRFSVTPSSIDRPAPLLGEHTREVFSRLQASDGHDGPVTRSGREGDPGRQGPLQGVRVADFSWAWAGAHIGELLTSLGAEVIKIESAQRIDITRVQAFTTGQQFATANESPVFNDLNLGKLGITLNLSQPQAIELARKLIGVSDVVVQNMRPGVMERLGLDYETVKEDRPDIIYLSSSACGSTGPERGYSGYAPNFAALGGVSHITGDPDGEPGRMTGEIDLLSAVTSTFAILAALDYRLKTGKGQHVDVSSTEATSALIGETLMDYLANDRVQTRSGNRHEFMAPHNCYRCKGEDRWISIAVANDDEWKAFCKALGNPDWTEGPRFVSASARWQNQEELDSLIEEWTVNHDNHEVMEMLQEAGVAAMPCYNAEELYKNPHLQFRQCWAKVIHPVLKEQVVLSPPWKLSATPVRVSSAAPLLGEHNNYVFGELLGIPGEELARLAEEKVIY